VHSKDTLNVSDISNTARLGVIFIYSVRNLLVLFAENFSDSALVEKRIARVDPFWILYCDSQISTSSLFCSCHHDFIL
jgi:hypothetical protein